ncbi:MAG: BREX-1 system adenine-specific DNA-methyltransferase PglX, partial [Clostridiales bacterium]|nr:BREX-1 system adenine-specific DNA-methyltransferase PglX [Clostridiales bacterium]
YEIYLSAGYSEREIPTLILEKNLYGLDIDDRAGQLATFALLMKARSKNRRIFRHKPKMNLCSIQESNDIPKEAIEYICKGDFKSSEIKEGIEYLIEVFHDAKEYGSILEVKEIDFEALEKRIEEIRNNVPEDIFELQYREIILEKIPPLIEQAKIMSQKYEVVCTNPPYMGRSSMNPKLKEYIDENFSSTKNDLYAVFIEKCLKMIKVTGFNAMITMHSWMFLDAFKKLRRGILDNYSLYSIVHLGMEAFTNIIGKVVQTVAFVIRKTKLTDIYPTSIRLVDFYDSRKYEKEIQFFNPKYRYNVVSQKDFKNIPNLTIAYWISKRMMAIFKEKNNFNKIIECKTGLVAGNNIKYFRYWHEVKFNKIGFNYSCIERTKLCIHKWYPLNHGGDRRKWYGNHLEVVDLYDNAINIRQEKNSMLRNSQYYFKKGINWNRVGSSVKFAARVSLSGFVFDDVSPTGFPKKDEYYEYCLGFLNSKVFNSLLNIINTGIKTEIGHISRIPIFIPKFTTMSTIKKLSNECIKMTKTDWDSFETSWDFKNHPLLTYKKEADTIEEAFTNWSNFAENQFNQLKANEEELNRIFIEIYGLQDELTPEVEDKDITITRIYDSKEDIPESMKGNNYVLTREDVIKSFISYAVGCMFGRYSLDEEGLIYAGGDFDDKFRLRDGQWEIKTKEGWK